MPPVFQVNATFVMSLHAYEIFLTVAFQLTVVSEKSDVGTAMADVMKEAGTYVDC